MEMIDILEKYQIKFSTPIDYALHNKFKSINTWLSAFIGDNHRVYDVDALLGSINEALNDISLNVYFDTLSLQVAIINSNETKIYDDLDSYMNDNTIAQIFTLPTADFKVIVTAWKDYLIQSPATPK